MTVTEAVLLTIVIIMVFTWAMSLPQGTTIGSKIWDCVDRSTGETSTVKMDYSHPSGCKCPKHAGTTETKAAAENFEYFDNCQSTADLKQTLGTNCNDTPFNYEVNEFGSEGMDFKDWVASQAVDPQMIKNHSEFIQDRFQQRGQNQLGRTYSPDSHDSYDPIPWMGLRRPQAVKLSGINAQVPDVDYDLYSKNPTFTWSSSQ